MATAVAERDVAREITLDVGQQADFFYSDAPFPGYFGGVGIGKTMALVLNFFGYATEWPGSRQILTEPTNPMIGDILAPTIRDIYGHAEGRAWHIKQDPWNVYFPNGSEIWLRSAEVSAGQPGMERRRGPNIARFGMDEVTLGHQEYAFQMLAARLRQPDFPHQGLVTGTPKGRNWVHRDWVAQPKQGYAAHFSTTADNKHLPPHYLERLLETYGADTDLARQELEGAWLEFHGQVFPSFKRHVHIRELPCQPLQLKKRVGGIDFGGVSPTALVAVGLDGSGRTYAYREWYRRNATLEELALAMQDFQREGGVTHWLYDPSAEKDDVAFLMRLFSMRPAPSNEIKVRARILNSRLALSGDGKPGGYITPGCPNLIAEVESLTWQSIIIGGGREILNDRWTRGAPDHAVDADAYAHMDIDLIKPQPYEGQIQMYGKTWKAGT